MTRRSSSTKPWHDALFSDMPYFLQRTGRAQPAFSNALTAMAARIIRTSVMAPCTVMTRQTKTRISVCHVSVWTRSFYATTPDDVFQVSCLQACQNVNIEGILPKGSYLPCVSMAGRALLAGYPRYVPIYTRCRDAYQISERYGSSKYISRGLEMSRDLGVRRLNSTPLNKMAAISQTVFSDAFSWLKISVLD